MGKKIAIIGAGNAGYHQAADLTQAGHEITLYEMPRFKSNLEAVLNNGGITLVGRSRHVGFARIDADQVTTDMGKAIEGADIISVNVVAMGHQKIAELCSPHLDDGQIVILAPGSAGSMLFAKNLAKKGVKKKIYVSELLSSWGTQRVVDRVASVCRVYARPLWIRPGVGMRVAAFPAKDTDYVIRKLGEVYESPCTFIPGKNVMEVGLNNPNICHVPGTILSTTWIEYLEKRGCLDSNPLRILPPFKMWHAFANSPGAQKCSLVYNKERAAVLEKIGCKDYSQPIGKPVEKLGNPQFEGITGPPRLNHRYISEDVPVGNVLLSSLGRMLGVPTPLTDSFIRIAGVINDVDYWTVPWARTVEKIGVAGMTARELAEFLEEGSY